MRLKNFFIMLTLFFLTLFGTTNVMAKGVNNRQDNILANAKLKADKAIDSRISVLNKLMSTTQINKTLSFNDKSAIVMDIQNSISVLNQQKSKVDSDTNIQSVRADIKPVMNLQIYALVIPKDRLLVTADDMTTLTTKLQNLTPQIQKLINDSKSQGKNVTSAQIQLDTINSLLGSINNRLTTDKKALLSIEQNNPTNAATLISIRQDLSSTRADFTKIKSNFKQLRGSL